jgi:hypothetical protein
MLSHCRILPNLSEKSTIHFNGNYAKIYGFEINDDGKILADNPTNYTTPKLNYIPSERNITAIAHNFHNLSVADAVKFFE